MTQPSENIPISGQQPPANSEQAQELIGKLRRKEGSWVDWGNACDALQKSGYNSQQIFQETGFEPVHQNQIIVGAAVYKSMVNAVVSEEVRSYFLGPKVDILYELRILAQKERVAASEFIWEHNLDLDDARDVAKAMKDISRMRTLPEGFSDHPGDIVAYRCWKLARQQKDLQERSRLIAKGLKLAKTQSARQQVEQLLTDFTVVPKRPKPILPVYRIESQEELPRILPVVGQLPLTPEDLKAVPLTEESGPFQMVKFSGAGAWVALPGWQRLMNAEDPVTVIGGSDRLPGLLSDKSEEVLIVVDRSERQWQPDFYFMVELAGQLEVQWFEEAPELPILGKVIVLVRPKKIFDEEIVRDQWQIDD